MTLAQGRGCLSGEKVGLGPGTLEGEGHWFLGCTWTDLQHTASCFLPRGSALLRRQVTQDRNHPTLTSRQAGNHTEDKGRQESRRAPGLFSEDRSSHSETLPGFNPKP